jgi:hypothetical protein
LTLSNKQRVENAIREFPERTFTSPELSERIRTALGKKVLETKNISQIIRAHGLAKCISSERVRTNHNLSNTTLVVYEKWED